MRGRFFVSLITLFFRFFFLVGSHFKWTKKRLPNHHGRSSRLLQWFGFLELFSVGNRLFTTTPFPDFFCWMAGKTPFNLISW